MYKKTMLVKIIAAGLAVVWLLPCLSCDRFTEQVDCYYMPDADCSSSFSPDREFFKCKEFYLLYEIGHPDLDWPVQVGVDTVEMLWASLNGDPGAMAAIFSDDELRTLIENNAYRRGIPLPPTDWTIGRCRVPLVTPGSDEERLVHDILFRREEGFIVMSSPYDGSDIYLKDVDYVKFRGSPVIRIPEPFEE